MSPWPAVSTECSDRRHLYCLYAECTCVCHEATDEADDGDPMARAWLQDHDGEPRLW